MRDAAAVSRGSAVCHGSEQRQRDAKFDAPVTCDVLDERLFDHLRVGEEEDDGRAHAAVLGLVAARGEEALFEILAKFIDPVAFGELFSRVRTAIG